MHWNHPDTRSGTDGDRPNVAVASLEGMLVNLHLGETAAFQIWTRQDGGGFALLEERIAPEPGTRDRWEQLARILYDCRAVLAKAMGQVPARVLSDRGITPLVMEGLVEEGLKAVYEDREIGPFAPRRTKGCSRSGCGEGC